MSEEELTTGRGLAAAVVVRRAHVVVAAQQWAQATPAGYAAAARTLAGAVSRLNSTEDRLRAVIEEQRRQERHTELPLDVS